jgi:hypothetical protein
MRNHLSKLVIFTLLALLVGASGQALADSNHAFPLFRTGVGARALGMGGAYVAVANDATAGYWNPAGLTGIENFNISSMISADMTYDRQYNYVALGYNFGRAGWAAMSWVNFGVDDIKQYESSSTSPVNEFNADDHGFFFSYGNAMNDLHVGITAKVAYQTIGEWESQTGIGFDAGLKYVVNENFHLGATAHDLGTKVGDYNIPVSFRLGMAAFAFDGFTFAADVVKIQDESDVEVHLGSEYDYEFAENYFGAIRAGVNDGEFTVGAGLTVMGQYSIDYSYVSEAESFLEHSHRVSLTLSF